MQDWRQAAFRETTVRRRRDDDPLIRAAGPGTMPKIGIFR